MIIWFTGFSGSGKSTLSSNLYEYIKQKYTVKLYDGDSIREITNNHNFDMDSRFKQIKIVRDFIFKNVDMYNYHIVAMITPLEKMRSDNRIIFKNRYFEVYCNCPLEEAEKRDIKGLYKKARMGEIKDMTGIDSPFEYPLHSDLVCNTDCEDIETSVSKIIGKLKM